MSSQAVARRYASALADVAIQRREEREVQRELEQWAAMIEASPQLQEVLANPTVVYEQKRTVLEELISRTRVRETTGSFLRVLLKTNASRSCEVLLRDMVRCWTNAPALSPRV